VQIGVDGDAYADTDPSALTDYRSTLDPYGTWVEDPTYGTVWVPNSDQVGSDFTPYVSAGHWVYDDNDDYVWMSDYGWGWVPFHYGRWVWTGSRDWAWVAGRTYAGAWVSWRVGERDGGYVGWAPRPPNWIWRHGVAQELGVVPWTPFVFSPREERSSPRASRRTSSPATEQPSLLRTRGRISTPLPYLQGTTRSRCRSCTARLLPPWASTTRISCVRRPQSTASPRLAGTRVRPQRCRWARTRRFRTSCAPLLS
jgi:hypothetical protein